MPGIRTLLVYAVIAAALIGVGAAGAAKHYAPLLRAEHDERISFKAGVDVLAKAAQDRKAKQETDDRKRKQDADKENASDRDRDARTIAKLRDDLAKRTNGRFVPSAAPNSRNPALACFDRVELESAIRGLVGGVRGLVDEGTAAAIDIQTARKWASGQALQP